MNSRNLEKIKKVAEKFFQKLTFPGTIKIEENKEGTILIAFQSEEPQILIGQKGETLLEIQHLLRHLVLKELKERIFIDLDINDYKKKKTEYLKDLARSTADEVSLSKKEKVLPPMPAYERRIVHLELAERGDVVTESAGEGSERKVVIKPAA